MDPFTHPDNVDLAGYLEVLMDPPRVPSKRASDAAPESRAVRAGEQPRECIHPCEAYAWRYLWS